MQTDPRLLRVLSPVERRRAASYSQWFDRHRFVTARALLRIVLAEQLLMPADSFLIETICRTCGSREHGRPEVAGLELSVSISHSGEKVGVAVTGSRIGGGHVASTIGLDIESTTNRFQPAKCEIAEVALTSAEHQIWKVLPPEYREVAALTWWTRKESILKATGWGLAIPPNLLEVTQPFDRPAITRWAPEAVRLMGRVLPTVHLYDVQAGPEYVGSLASLGAPVLLSQQAGDQLLAEAMA